MGNWLFGSKRDNANTNPIFTDDGNYNPDERTRRIIGILEAEFGAIEDRIKIKDIGKRNFEKIDV